MSDETVTERFPDALADVAVGPPPLDRMRADAVRIRRGRRAAITSAAAVVAVVGGVTAWSALGGDAVDEVPPAAGPATTQQVGLAGVVVAAPAGWVRDDGPATAYCGAENPGVVVYHAPDCGPTRQDTVHLFRGERPSGLAGEQIEVDGVAAYRSTVRARFADPDDGQPTVWAGEVYVDGVVVAVLSSVGPAEVEDLLDSVALDEGRRR